MCFLDMKKIVIALICGCLLMGANDTFAQSKTGNSTSKTTTSKSSKKKKKVVEAPKPVEVELRYNSNDCLFPMDIQCDEVFGPTQAPNGAGQVNEIQSDKKHPYLFEYEHNTVWYRFTAPYNGYLEFTITPTNPKDDYDFLVYKYTDVYFSNHVIQNKVLPLAGVVNAIDTTSKTGAVGMKHDAKETFVSKKQMTSFVKSLFVKKGEVYYICVDNCSSKGSGHTIKTSLYVDSYEPVVLFYDTKTRKSIDVDLLVIEKNTDNRAIVKNPKFRKGVIKFVPHFEYTLYAKKDGFFSIYKDFNADIYKGDTILRFLMNRIERGTKYSISDIYFDNDESELLPESDTALMNYVAMFRNHPNVSFLIKGYVQTYGFDVDGDVQMSLARAISVKEFFVKNGLPADKISVAGMTKTEVKRAAAAVLNKDQYNDAKVEIVITGIE